MFSCRFMLPVFWYGFLALISGTVRVSWAIDTNETRLREYNIIKACWHVSNVKQICNIAMSLQMN